MQQDTPKLIAVSVVYFLMAVSIIARADFTEVQAQNGAREYLQYCAECHGGNLQGSAHGSELAGQGFLDQWANRSVGEFIALVSATMSMGVPRSSRESINLNITSFILRTNGAVAGEKRCRQAQVNLSPPRSGVSQPLHRKRNPSSGKVPVALRRLPAKHRVL